MPRCRERERHKPHAIAIPLQINGRHELVIDEHLDPREPDRLIARRTREGIETQRQAVILSARQWNPHDSAPPRRDAGRNVAIDEGSLM